MAEATLPGRLTPHTVPEGRGISWHLLQKRSSKLLVVVVFLQKRRQQKRSLRWR